MNIAQLKTVKKLALKKPAWGGLFYPPGYHAKVKSHLMISTLAVWRAIKISKYYASHHVVIFVCFVIMGILSVDCSDYLLADIFFR